MIDWLIEVLLNLALRALVWLAGGDIEALNALFEILDAEEWP